MKRAIIIGATSGIGRGLAQLLVKNDYKVGITGRRINLLEELKQESPGHYIVKSFDIMDAENIPDNLNAITNELGGLDLIIISSGIGNYNYNLDFEIEKNTIDTNVSGFTAIADWAYKYFKQNDSGHLVAITSIAGLRGNRVSPSYSGSKAFQMKYLEGLRQKAKKEKFPIVISDIRPGYVDSNMTKGETGLFWLASMDVATAQIYNAIKRKKEIVYITKRWAIIAFILKLLPRFIFERF